MSKTDSISGATMGVIALKFSSSPAKDEVIFFTSKLKNITAVKLFSKGGDSGIYVNEILSGPVFKPAGA